MINSPVAIMRAFSQNFLTTAKIFAVSRAVISGIIVMASQTKFYPIPSREGFDYHPAFTWNPAEFLHSLILTLCSADAGWYLKIAKYGYDPGPFTADVPHNWVFFPLFPLLIRCLAGVFRSYLFSAFVISNVSFFAGLYCLLLLLQQQGYSRTLITRVLWLVAINPVSYFFLAPWTESLFFFLLVSVFLLLERSRPLAAGAVMMLASATRPTGLLILPGFLYALHERKMLTKASGLAAAALTPLGTASFAVFLYFHTGNAMAFSANQIAWGRNTGSLPARLLQLLSSLGDIIAPWNFILLSALSTAVALAAGVHLCRRGQISWALVILVPLAVALSTGTFWSIARFVMVLFPVFVVIAEWAEDSERERIVFFLSAFALSALTLLYALHFTPAMN